MNTAHGWQHQMMTSIKNLSDVSRLNNMRYYVKQARDSHKEQGNSSVAKVFGEALALIERKIRK